MKEVIEKLLEIVDNGITLISSTENGIITINEDEIEEAREIIRIGILFYESAEKEQERIRFLLIQELRKNGNVFSE